MYNFGQYLYNESIIHDMDPRVKIGSVLLLSLMILKGALFTEAMITLFLIALIAISHLSVRNVLKALRPMVIFFMLLFFLHLIFTEGTPIPPFLPWHVAPTFEGLHKGTMITWQFLLLILNASILTMTTSPTELINGIERLLRPLKVLRIPSHDVAIMVSIALRFVPTLLQEVHKVREAQMARGARFTTGPWARRIKATAWLLIPIIQSSFRRADELATAMEARGYMRGPRTSMKELRMSQKDYGSIMVMILITGAHLFHGYIF
ncbi:MAG: energy-coupling factor transporter transmembrane component T [Pseudomonadota bacterium]